MEESKVKTAKDINVLQLDKNQIIDECTGDYLLGEKTGIKEIILNAMDRWLEQESSMLQSHITKLEVRNKELEALVKELIPIAKDGYRLHIKNACHQDFLEEDEELLSKAEQALNNK